MVACLIVPTLLLASARAAALPPKGAAAWVYDAKGGQPAMWSSNIAEFNTQAANKGINTIWSYGGDMEQWSGKFYSYFPAQSQQEATIYKNTTGVEYVVAVVDGRMDGKQTWSPDLSKLSTAQVQQWADVTADTYCSFQQIDGLQLDLEPFAAPYLDNLLLFLARLSANLRSPERNCVSPAHPDGRSLTTFLMAESATPAVWQALGPNGFLTISGCDQSGRLSRQPPPTTNH